MPESDAILVTFPALPPVLSQCSSRRTLFTEVSPAVFLYVRLPVVWGRYFPPWEPVGHYRSGGLGSSRCIDRRRYRVSSVQLCYLSLWMPHPACRRWHALKPLDWIFIIHLTSSVATTVVKNATIVVIRVFVLAGVIIIFLIKKRVRSLFGRWGFHFHRRRLRKSFHLRRRSRWTPGRYKGSHSRMISVAPWYWFIPLRASSMSVPILLVACSTFPL
jgi:hypothetical protein